MSGKQQLSAIAGADSDYQLLSRVLFGNHPQVNNMSTNGLQPFDDPPIARRGSPELIYVIFAGVVALVTFAGVIVTLIAWAHGGQAAPALIATAITGLLLLGACGLAIAFLGIKASRHMARLIEQITTLEQRTALLAEQSFAQSREESTTPASLAITGELLTLFKDIRDILLLPQELRIRRYQAMAEAEFQRRLTAADRHIASGNFHRAREELTFLADRFGDDERVREARGRLERAAEQTRAQDIAQAGARSQDLMSVGKWVEAEQLLRELADKYPAAPEPAALYERMNKERGLFELRHRQRMLDEIQQQVRQRRWREAADGTRKFLQMFPQDVESTPLSEQLKTINANAEIQTRQLLEQEYKELLAQHRYWDAVGLARRIIGEFPFSPQANALRGQVARLEELARRHEPQA